jgi:hypothetical protein
MLPPNVSGDKSFVPIRYLGEAIGANVSSTLRQYLLKAILIMLVHESQENLYRASAKVVNNPVPLTRYDARLQHLNCQNIE